MHLSENTPCFGVLPFCPIESSSLIIALMVEHSGLTHKKLGFLREENSFHFSWLLPSRGWCVKDSWTLSDHFDTDLHHWEDNTSFTVNMALILPYRLCVCRGHVLWVAFELAFNLAYKVPYVLEKTFQVAGAACDWLGGKVCNSCFALVNPFLVYM